MLIWGFWRGWMIGGWISEWVGNKTEECWVLIWKVWVGYVAHLVSRKICLVSLSPLSGSVS